MEKSTESDEAVRLGNAEMYLLMAEDILCQCSDPKWAQMGSNISSMRMELLEAMRGVGGVGGYKGPKL